MFNRWFLNRRHLQNAGIFICPFAVQQAQARKSHAVKNLEDGFPIEFTALKFSEVSAVVGFALEALVADGAFTFFVITLHRYLRDDASLHELVGQLGIGRVSGIEFTHAFDPAADFIFQIISRHNSTDDVAKLLRVLKIDLLVDDGHVPCGQLLGGEMITIAIGAGSAEDEGKLGITRETSAHRFGVQPRIFIEAELHRDGGMDIGCGSHRNRLCRLISIRTGLVSFQANEKAFLGTGSLSMLGGDRILVVLGFHPALTPQTADDLFHLLFVRIGVVAV